MDARVIYNNVNDKYRAMTDRAGAAQYAVGIPFSKSDKNKGRLLVGDFRVGLPRS